MTTIQQQPYLTLNNGHSMPQLGLGTWLSKPGEVGAAVQWAIDAGYRHIDCAYIYQNQDEIGRTLEKVFANGQVKREDLFITSKVWNTCHSKARALQNVEDILQELRVDYLDLCLIHWPHGFKEGTGTLFPTKEGTEDVLYSDVDYLETWSALEESVKLGKIRSIGLSNFNSEQITRVIQNSSIHPVVNQVECHPYFNQQRLKDFCAEQEMFLMAYSPLSNPANPFRLPGTPSVLENPVIHELAEKHNKTPAQIAIRWAIQRGTCVIPKSVTKARIEENWNIFEFHLASGDMDQMHALDQGPEGRIVRLERDRMHPFFPFTIPF